MEMIMSNNKIAICSGFSGQDGRYLAKLLLEKNYKVYGMVRRTSNPDMSFVKELGLEDVTIVEADLSDSASLQHVISAIKPDEFYNLAAQSFVHSSYNQAEYTIDVNGTGVARILEQIRMHSPHTKFYNAATSELFGDAKEVPQNENTPFRPRSPYAAAKALAFYMVKVYRESYGLFACSGILHNHESPYRSKQFVTRKITDWIGQYIAGVHTAPLKLGNLNAKRDWGFAGDYVRAMYLMMQRESPEDYLIATGETYTVRDFCQRAFALAGIELEWKGDTADTEYAIDSKTKDTLLYVDKELYRPAEVNILLGDCSKARKELGWYPEVSFEQLIEMMVLADIERYQNVYSPAKTNG